MASLQFSFALLFTVICVVIARSPLQRGPPPECQLQADHGPCEALQIQFYYNHTQRMCHAFRYGGCRGNANRFSSMRACYYHCKRHHHHHHHRHHPHGRRKRCGLIIAVVVGVISVLSAVAAVYAHRRWKARQGVQRQILHEEPTLDFDEITTEKKAGPPPVQSTIDAATLPPAQLGPTTEA